jgi:pimeloyl-ACP methyl ester carboxylesterase
MATSIKDTETMPSIAPAVEKFVQITDVNARYIETGEGEPTIVIHGVGFTNSGEVWLPAIRAGLGDKLHLYCMDNVGWGAGDRPNSEYSISYFADYIREVQDAFGYSRTNIIGHSLGGWIAAIFAYESPNRVRRLVLDNIAGMNATPPPNVAGFKPPTHEQLRGGLPERFSAVRDIEEQASFQWRNVNTPGATEAFTQITKHLNDGAMRRRYHLKRRLSKINVPTMVSWGREAGGLFPVSAGQEIAASIPGARLELYDGDHFANQQNPDQFVKLMTDFLA